MLGRAQASERPGGELQTMLSRRLPAWAVSVRAVDVMRALSPSRVREATFLRSGWDARRTLRRVARTGLLSASLIPGKRYRKPERLVVLWDVSGSMADQVDLYLPWIYRLVSTSREVGVFAFGTDLQDVSLSLRGDYGRAVATLYSLTGLWAGGTSIGLSLLSWLDRYGTAYLRGAVRILVISDGWDSGRPDDVAAAMLAIRRRGARIDWVHPLLSSPGFALRTRSLLAARPFVDHWLAGANSTELLRIRLV